MPTISYQEIATPDVIESGLVKHEWILDSDGLELIHISDGEFEFLYIGSEAAQIWENLKHGKNF